MGWMMTAMRRVSDMICRHCNEYVESGTDEFGRCRVCRKTEMEGSK